MKHKLELSLTIGLAVMLLFSALHLQPMQWWGVVFSPLCGGQFSSGSEIILRSRFLELLRGCC